MNTEEKLAPRHLYLQLAERLRSGIFQEAFPTGRLPTEAQLGQQHGVSVVTVRKALRVLTDERLIRRRQGCGTFVAGWRSAMRPRTRGNALISYISGAGSESVAGSFFNRLMLATQQAAERRGFNTVFSSAKAGEIPLPVQKRRVDAVILAGTFRGTAPQESLLPALEADNTRYLQELSQSRLPVVTISNHGNWPNVHRMLPDYDGAMSRAMEELHSAGHRRIGVWGGPFDWPPFRERLQAIQRSAEGLGLKIGRDDIIALDGFSFLAAERYAQQLLKWLATHPRHTALVIVTNPATLACRAIEAAGYGIPRDISVIALSNLPPPTSPGFRFEDPHEAVPPQLTVFEMPIEALADLAVERAVRLAAGHAVPACERTVTVPLLYHVGATVCRPSARQTGSKAIRSGSDRPKTASVRQGR